MVDAPLDGGVRRGGQFGDGVVKAQEHVVLIALKAGHQAGEVIRVEPAAHAVIAHGPAVFVRDGDQQLVRGFRAEDVVDDLEVFYVGAEDVVMLARVLVERLAHAAEEELAAVEPVSRSNLKWLMSAELSRRRMMLATRCSMICGL